MTLQEFNAADEPVARATLLRCCGSHRWAEAISALRPFRDRQTLSSIAESIWWTLQRGDWLEAFSAHPRIGDKNVTDWSRREQAGVDSASTRILERLVAGNQDYERRFGWIFLINATGKSASEMLDSLQARLTNAPAEELFIAAGEQAKITTLRLDKLFEL